jgi:hypothetical protein
MESNHDELPQTLVDHVLLHNLVEFENELDILKEFENELNKFKEFNNELDKLKKDKIMSIVKQLVEFENELDNLKEDKIMSIENLVMLVEKIKNTSSVEEQELIKIQQDIDEARKCLDIAKAHAISKQTKAKETDFCKECCWTCGVCCIMPCVMPCIMMNELTKKCWTDYCNWNNI